MRFRCRGWWLILLIVVGTPSGLSVASADEFDGDWVDDEGVLAHIAALEQAHTQTETAVDIGDTNAADEVMDADELSEEYEYASALTERLILTSQTCGFAEKMLMKPLQRCAAHRSSSPSFLLLTRCRFCALLEEQDAGAQ